MEITKEELLAYFKLSRLLQDADFKVTDSSGNEVELAYWSLESDKVYRKWFKIDEAVSFLQYAIKKNFDKDFIVSILEK